MKTDEIYKFIGYAVVIVVIFYIVANTIRLQTGVLVEGWGNRKKSSSSSSSVGDGGGGDAGTSNDLKSLCEIKKVDKLKKTEEDNVINHVLDIKKKFEDATCSVYRIHIPYYSSRKIIKELNLLYDSCIDTQKILLASQGVSYARRYIENEEDREQALEDITRIYNGINAFKYSKKCFNAIYNN